MPPTLTAPCVWISIAPPPVVIVPVFENVLASEPATYAVFTVKSPPPVVTSPVTVTLPALVLVVPSVTPPPVEVKLPTSTLAPCRAIAPPTLMVLVTSSNVKSP